MRLFRMFVFGLLVLVGQQAQANIFSDWWTKIKSWFCTEDKVLMERAEQQEQRARAEIEALEAKEHRAAAHEHESAGAPGAESEHTAGHDQSASVPHDEGQGHDYGHEQAHSDSQESTAQHSDRE